ncbi:rhamnan synthesis F family protein [Gymnodinialimonas sp. 2305UL16-5]|uniref:rhamnan synthesis F family protein n=1 Tax=Gymnodinialimonas mytili TaxID=3126503 RepID=UPI0030A1E12D
MARQGKTSWRLKPFSPMWKIRRELNRIKMQITAPLSLATNWITRPIYDWKKHSKIIITDGDVPQKPDIAVFLIYCPKKLKKSYFHTLNHLREKGFAVFVVANHPLSDEMRRELAPYSWQIMERPNVGYDFGGYREAILNLKARSIELEHLLICNDSVWFPLYEDDNMLDEMRSWNANIRGFCMDRHKRSNNPPFVQSFMFIYDRTIYQHPAFLQYWKSIVLTKNKYLVIRKLEMGMTRYFERHGFTNFARHDYRRIGETLSQLSEDRLLRFVEIEEDRLNGKAPDIIKRIQADGKSAISLEELKEIGSLSQVDGHILKLPPELLFDVFDINMLKKLKHGHFTEQRAKIIDGGYHENLLPTIRDELLNWDSPREMAIIKKREAKKRAAQEKMRQRG